MQLQNEYRCIVTYKYPHMVTVVSYYPLYSESIISVKILEHFQFNKLTAIKQGIKLTAKAVGNN